VAHANAGSGGGGGAEEEEEEGQEARSEAGTIISGGGGAGGRSHRTKSPAREEDGLPPTGACVKASSRCVAAVSAGKSSEPWQR
jgi:hypothetical protein